MRSVVWCILVGLLAVAAARRTDQDFEFDDDADTTAVENSLHVRRPRRYIYDPENAQCRTLVCKKREVCVLKDAFTALCANKKDIIRKGDILMTARTGSNENDGDNEDDVFYDSADSVDHQSDDKPTRCVGCGHAPRGGFVCGSDNRTYSSLCRLDLHNCVRRPRTPVALACAGFCPCAPSSPPRPHGRRARPRTHSEKGSGGCALDEMADRLLDWFSVLMEEAGATAPSAHGFPNYCKPEVRWMFEHLDTDGDGILSAKNLYALRHDERERCLRPFLSSCGMSGVSDMSDGSGVSRGAWCACMRRAARPCTALARAHPPAPGAWVPRCDARGFYKPRQCHSALGVCWCVDSHGAERPNTRTRGLAFCPGDHIAAPDDDEDADGSGDNELHF